MTGHHAQKHLGTAGHFCACDSVCGTSFSFLVGMGVHHPLQFSGKQEKNNRCRTAHENKQHEEIKQIFYSIPHETAHRSVLRIITAQKSRKLVGSRCAEVPHSHQKRRKAGWRQLVDN